MTEIPPYGSITTHKIKVGWERYPDESLRIDEYTPKGWTVREGNITMVWKHKQTLRKPMQELAGYLFIEHGIQVTKKEKIYHKNLRKD